MYKAVGTVVQIALLGVMTIAAGVIGGIGYELLQIGWNIVQ